MANIYYDRDTELSLVRAKKVAVLGYGSQGHAHALNLRDSGVEVRVALAPNSRSRQKAQQDGCTVVSPAEASAWADIVVVLIPDTAQSALYEEAIAPNLAAGKTLLFAHGFNIHFGSMVPKWMLKP